MLINEITKTKRPKFVLLTMGGLHMPAAFVAIQQSRDDLDHILDNYIGAPSEESAGSAVSGESLRSVSGGSGRSGRSLGAGVPRPIAGACVGADARLGPSSAAPGSVSTPALDAGVSWAGGSGTPTSAPSGLGNAKAEAELKKKLACASNPSIMAPRLTPSQVDMYGFKKQTMYVSEQAHDEWWAQHQHYIEKRRTKWQALMESNGLSAEDPVRFPPKSAKLKRYVRKGIPPEWRGAAWFWYARGPERLSAHPNLYENIVESSKSLKNADTEHIERDLFRTFPDNAHFRSDPDTQEESKLLQSLRRVLVAFSVYQPKIGYCQSLNFVAGTLLLFMCEEHAFWMLVIITQHYVPGLHEINLEQVNISQGVLMVNIRDRLPKAWQALKLEDQYQENFVTNLPPISLCTASWFMSLFVSILPFETMLRVWDAFFFEGSQVLYRISLAIFKMLEPQIGSLQDDMEVFQRIQNYPHTILNPNDLMQACFKRVNGFGHISQVDIKSVHQFVAERRRSASTSESTDKDEYTKFHPRQRIRSRLRLY